jgi:hypothetical protein
MPKQDTFRIAVRKFGPFETAMQKFWDQYCDFSGCKLKLELVIMELHELHEQTLTESGLANGNFDVAHINTDWIYEGFQANAFETLNTYIEKNPPADFPQGWSNSLLSLQEIKGNIVGNINIDSPAAIEGLDFYRKIVKDKTAVHPGSSNFDSVAAGHAFGQGEAAMMINWFGFAAMCDVDSNSKVKGKVYVSLLPSNSDQNSASLNVYWLYTIGKGSLHKAIAYDFLRFVTSAANDKLLTLEGGIGCRISTWNDAQINRLIPYYHKLETLHVVARMLPQKKNWAKIATIIDKLVLDAIHTSQSSSTLLAKAQQEIDLIDQ